MTENVSQRDMRLQRQIAADAKMREIVKRSENWPDPAVKKTLRTLKPIHRPVNPHTLALIEAERAKVQP